jgi:hypothetical protein
MRLGEKMDEEDENVRRGTEGYLSYGLSRISG